MEQKNIRFYGRRYGRPLTPARRRLIDEALPAFALKLDQPTADLNAFFDPPLSRFWLEIGFGAGEHLAALAADHPDVGFVGCEPYINGIGSLLAKVCTNDAARRPKNIKIYPDDARLLLPNLPTAAFDRIYAMFPDPWPKTRHHRRRLIAPETLDEIARLLKPGGIFRMASDHMEYIRWTLFHVRRHAAFEWVARRPVDWRRRYDDSTPTRYEAKAVSKGAECVYLTFRRRP